MVRFELLGAISLRRGKRNGRIARSQNRGLLALLALNVNILVTHDAAIEALWGGRPPNSARTQIHTGVHAIRNALRTLDAEDHLTSSSTGYSLRLDPEQIDVGLFERKITQARATAAAGKHAEARTLLEQGLSLWQGPALGDTAGAFVSSARERLEQQRVNAAEELIGLELHAGRHAHIVDRFSPMVEQHPLREKLRAQMMLAQFRVGDKVSALQGYHRFRTRLADEIGLDPSPQLQALQQAIIRADRRLEPGNDGVRSIVGSTLAPPRDTCDCQSV